MDKQSQLKKIKEHLLSGHTITPIEALQLYGCMRLGARIYDLKKQGMNIQKKMVKKLSKTYAMYYLAEETN